MGTHFTTKVALAKNLWLQMALLGVVAFNTAGRWSRDVSEEIAMKVVAAARDDGRELGAGARDLVKRATGCDVSELARSAPSS